MGQAATRILLDEILPRLTQGVGCSLYDAMVVVTSAARDAHDPQVRWQLEEFGGHVPGLFRTIQRAAGPGAQLVEA